jgi:hypothetical protein
VVPILAELARQACFDPVGEGNWVFEPSLEGQTYDAPEEVMGRPYSQRTDFIKYQVFRYSGFYGVTDGHVEKTVPGHQIRH